jgi:hypothetical protein
VSLLVDLLVEGQPEWSTHKCFSNRIAAGSVTSRDIRTVTDTAQWLQVESMDKDVQSYNLPALPRTARYVLHKNECYDWGAIGWLLNTGLVKPSRYKQVHCQFS